MGVLLAACGGENITPEPQPEPKPEPETRTLTFVLPEDGSKTAWEAGDAIVVHGEYAAEQVTVTLAAGDISSDGKTASKEVSGLYPYVREDIGSSLYAAWPADASQNLKHCFFYSGFNNTNTPMMAACNDEGDRFVFENLTSGITFTVDGDYDAYAFTGRKDATVGYEFFQVQITDREQNYNQHRESPMVTISGTIAPGSTTVQHIYFPGKLDLPKGYDLKLFKDGTAVKVYTDKDAVALTRGDVLALGDITSLLEDFEMDIDVTLATNLALEGNANCYIVYDSGVYKFPSVRGNGTQSVGSIDAVEVLWETWNNNEEVVRKSLIKSAQYEGGYIYILVPEPFHAGNALVAALDEDENILGSWHIWMPESPVTDVEGTDITGVQVMSRNLGALRDAVAGAVAPVESYGLFYQFGRKDPFPGGVTLAGTAVTAQEGQISVEESFAQPTVLYYTPDKDWQNGDESIPKFLWEDSGKKTLYDPCPPGYGLPARNKNYSLWSGNNLIGNINADLGLFSIGSTVIPMAGYYSDDDGTYQGAGTHILLWSEHYDSGTQNGYGLYGPYDDKGTETCKNRGNIRSMAGSVRCVKK